MILPHLTYGICGHCSKYLLQKLTLLQKRALRVITNSHYLAHTEPLFAKLEILSLPDLYIFHIAVFMYSAVNKLLPESFNNVTYKYSINNYSCRNSHDLYIPFYRYEVSRASLCYQGPQIWNDLSKNLKESPSLNVLKRKFKIVLQNEKDAK